jgi:DNA-damage-inducible protein J
MTAMDSSVRARIDSKLKADAEAVLSQIGLTPSDAFRMMMLRIVAEKKLPFEPLVPNKTTVAAMRDARAGRGARFETVDDLMADLNEAD